MKHLKLLLVLLALAILLVGCKKTEPYVESITEAKNIEATVETTVALEAPTEAPKEKSIVLQNVWDIMDNEGIEEIELLKGLEVNDIDTWQKKSPFNEIKLYQRTIFETLRLGTVGDVAVAQFVTNPDEYQTDYDYSADPVWNVRMEKSDSLKNNTGIEIPDDTWYAEYTVNRPNGKTATVVCYDWPIEGDPENTTAPVKTVELFLAYFEDTQNLYSIYTNEAVYTWNGEYWDNNMERDPFVVLNYIKADGSNYYNTISAYDLEHYKGEVRYFRIKMPGDMKTYQYEVGMNVEQWVKSKYNTDGWKLSPTEHGFYDICSPDGKNKLNPGDYVFGVLSTY